MRVSGIRALEAVLLGGCLTLLLGAGCKKDGESSSAAGAESATAASDSPAEPAEKAALAEPGSPSEAPAAQPAPEVPAETAPGESAADSPLEEPPAELDAGTRKRLEAAYTQAWCMMKGRRRAGLDKMFKRQGFDDPAAFSTAWSQAEASDPKWAEALMARTMGMDCALVLK